MCQYLSNSRRHQDLLLVQKIVIEMKSSNNLHIDRVAYTAIIDAFSNCGTIKVHPMENELRDSSQMTLIVRTSVALCTTVYVATSFFGFLLFGDHTLDRIPGTAARYRRNRCLGYKDRLLYLSPVEPGGLLQFMAPQLLPAAEAPNPILCDSDVVEPPLPPVAKITPAGNESIAAAPAPPSGQSSVVDGIFISCIAILLANLLFF